MTVTVSVTDSETDTVSVSQSLSVTVDLSTCEISVSTVFLLARPRLFARSDSSFTDSVINLIRSYSTGKLSLKIGITSMSAAVDHVGRHV